MPAMHGETSTASAGIPAGCTAGCGGSCISGAEQTRAAVAARANANAKVATKRTMSVLLLSVAVWVRRRRVPGRLFGGDLLVLRCRQQRFCLVGVGELELEQPAGTVRVAVHRRRIVVERAVDVDDL